MARRRAVVVGESNPFALGGAPADIARGGKSAMRSLFDAHGKASRNSCRVVGGAVVHDDDFYLVARKRLLLECAQAIGKGIRAVIDTDDDGKVGGHGSRHST